jgi:mono/diheme cytochrome c family protein
MKRLMSASALVAGVAIVLVSVTAWKRPDPKQDKTAQIARGRMLVIQADCGACHGGGSDPSAKGFLAGSTGPQFEFQIGECSMANPAAKPCFITRPKNLTPHPANGTGRYTERQIFNALRYGLQPSKTPDVELTGTTPGKGNFPAQPQYLAPPMPWTAWRHMPDEDLWAIAAYLKNGVKPVDNKVADSDAPPDFWASSWTVEKVGPYPAVPYPAANETGTTSPQIALGRRMVLSRACGDCHGGGNNPAAKGFLTGVTSKQMEFPIGACSFADPAAKPCFITRPKNLTPDNATGMGRFTERQVFNALRYGLRPEETPDVEITSATPGQGNFPLHPHYLAPPMPWTAWRHMSDEELKAIAAYLKNGLKPMTNKVLDSEGPPNFWATVYTVEKMGPLPAKPFPTENEKQ